MPTSKVTRRTPVASVASDQGIGSIPGVLGAAKANAKGGIYRGRFTCPDVQWTGTVLPDLFGTFTITAEQLADAADSGLLWTDQDVQRGVKPGLPNTPQKELSLQNGYPNPDQYVFDVEKADSIAEQLLRGERLFLNPLIWSLRPGAFEAYWSAGDRDFYLYSGRIYLPDSHHRHQGIVKAVNAWREAPNDYPKFSGSHQFKIELYFLSREDEGNYFYAKNQLSKPTAKSKAFDLTTLDALSLLAKKMIEKSESLRGNVNRVTDRLSPKNPQVVTLSTLREMMKSFAPSEDLDEVELEGLASVAAQFYDMLANVRTELGLLAVPLRKKVRKDLLVDAAVMMHGYAALMQDFNESLSRLGTHRAISHWRKALSSLNSTTSYRLGKWRGEFFDKANPLWLAVGVVKPSRDGQRLTVLNTGAARLECAAVLRRFLSSSTAPNADLKFLTIR
jgi:hypothetical protein